MKRVLLTGMSGTGKSSVIRELAALGHKAIDTDDGWCEQLPGGRQRWREDAIARLLDTEDADVLFIAGCEENQVRFHPRFDLIILLSAPAQTMIERLAARTGNPYGKAPGDMDRILGDLATVEPLLRKAADHEIRTTISLAGVVATVLHLAALSPDGHDTARAVLVGRAWLPIRGTSGWPWNTPRSCRSIARVPWALSCAVLSHSTLTALSGCAVAWQRRKDRAMQVFLETQRLVLRRFNVDDADNLVDLDADPDVMRFVTGGVPTSRDEVENEVLPAFLGYYERYEGYGFWAVIEKATGEFLGWFHFRPRADAVPGEVELGYRLCKSAWGKGYATEGSRALIRKGFTELGVQRVVAEAMAINTASRRVMEKVGLRLVWTFHQPWPYPIEGDQFGDVEYALDKASWQKQDQAEAGEREAE